MNDIVQIFACAGIKERSGKRLKSLNVDDMLIECNTYSIFRRKYFFLPIFGSLIFCLWLSSDILAADSLEELKKSAEQGNAQAQFRLGVMYAQGESLPENNVAEIVHKLLEFAEQGLDVAQYLSLIHI